MKYILNPLKEKLNKEKKEDFIQGLALITFFIVLYAIAWTI